MNHLFHFKSYFKFLERNKAYTLINVFGLSISLMFVILIGIYTQQEYNIDKMHSKADRIYALGGTVKGESQPFEASHHDIQARLLSRYPEIESTCAVSRAELYLNMPYGSKLKAKTLFVDSTFYKLFDFELIEGNRNTVLNEKNSAVVTQEYAKKIFGNVDPIGQTITYNDSIHLVVTGVAKKMENSCLSNNDMLIRFENAKNYNSALLGSGMGNATGASVFILTKPNTDLMSKTTDMKSYFKTFFWFYKMPDCADGVLLLPLNKLYFSNTDSCSEVTTRGDLKLVNILFTVGLVVLLFAIMNYINLTVAQSGFRAREMAIRRLLGSQRKEIIVRLIFESILLCFISLLIALALAFSLAPYANGILNTKLMMGNIFHVIDLSIIFFVLLVVGTLAGVFPAIVISASKPIEIVRGTFLRRTKMVFSKIFITFQNMITIVMIAVSLTMMLQIHHLIKAPLGYNTKGLVYISNPGDSTKATTFINELRNQSCISNVSACDGIPFDRGNNNTIPYQGKTISFQTLIGDTVYMDILGLKLRQDNHTANTTKRYYNMQAFNELGLKSDARSIPCFEDKSTIDGIIRDIHIGDITTEQHPLRVIIKKSIAQPWGFLIKVNGDAVEAYKQIQKTYSKIYQLSLDEDHPYIDQQIEQNFEKEIRLSHIISIFAFIAVLVSLLGLIAMSTYFIQQRRKEIAIRKVFGSTNVQIWKKLLKTFLTYVIIAFVLAIPVIYYFMSRWLSGYSYRISLNPWIFIIAGLFCLIISFVAVFVQSYQASNANPVDSVKDN